MTRRDSKDPEAEETLDSEADKPAATTGEGGRKNERVIHTRVPAVLEQELKRLAENIRVPVSNLVRTILEDAVDMADRAGRGVEEGMHRAASTLSSKREAILQKKERPAARPLDGVIGFQPLTLATDARCARCEIALDAGDDAHLGVSADPTSPRVVVCDACLPRKESTKKEKSK